MENLGTRITISRCTCIHKHTYVYSYSHICILLLNFLCDIQCIVIMCTHMLIDMHLCTHTFLLSAAPPSRPGFNGGMSSPSRCPFSSPTQLSQATLYPISSLNPYQSKWTIRVRVASKPSIQEWSNSQGQGKVFNVDLIDESVSK